MRSAAKYSGAAVSVGALVAVGAAVGGTGLAVGSASVGWVVAVAAAAVGVGVAAGWQAVSSRAATVISIKIRATFLVFISFSFEKGKQTGIKKPRQPNGIFGGLSAEFVELRSDVLSE
jgi:hypothetical protein